MSSTDPETDLLASARGGSAEAFAELYRLHDRAAIKYATWLAGANEAQDLVAEAFAKTFSALQQGRGPHTAFRAYVLAAVRTSNVDRIRRGGREVAVPDYSVLHSVPTTDDGSSERAEADAIQSAFRSLPARWQTVLWRTAVARDSLNVVATEMRMSANSVAALAHRAREGLRQAYLAQHHERVEGSDCAAYAQDLPKYVRGGLRGTQRSRIHGHLDECRTCSATAADLTAMSERLGAVLPPALLATGAAAPVAGIVTSLFAHAKAVAVSALAPVTATAAMVGGFVVLGPSAVEQHPPPQAGTAMVAEPGVVLQPKQSRPRAKTERPKSSSQVVTTDVPEVAAAVTHATNPAPSAQDAVTPSPAPAAVPSPTDGGAADTAVPPPAVPTTAPSADTGGYSVTSKPSPSNCTTKSTSSHTGTSSTTMTSTTCVYTYTFQSQ